MAITSIPHINKVIDILQCCHTCWFSYWKSAEIMGLCWSSNDATLQFVRLLHHMQWFPNPLHTYKVIHNSHVLCEWGYGRVSCCHHHTCWPRFGESAEIIVHCLASKMMPWCSGWVEALIPHGIAFTSTCSKHPRPSCDWHPSDTVDGDMDELLFR